MTTGEPPVRPVGALAPACDECGVLVIDKDTHRCVMTDYSFHFPGVYSVVAAGERQVQRIVTVKQFSWFCEREDCGCSRSGWESETEALNDAVWHQRDAHGVRLGGS